nr:expressed protein [Hymenolepis microstoma]
MSRSKGVKALFERMDADGSKQIDCRELRRALGEDKVSNEVIEMLFQKYDKNKDGYLNEKEIKKFFKENSLYLELCNEHMLPTSNKSTSGKSTK